MLREKVEMVLKSRRAKKKDLIDIWNLKGSASINYKFANESFTFQDMIKMCSALNYDIHIVDKETNETIVTFNSKDL